MRYTAEVVRQMVREKEEANAVSRYWVVDVERLEREAERALKKGQKEEYDQIRQKVTHTHPLFLHLLLCRSVKEASKNMM